MDENRILFLGESYTGTFTYVRGADYVTLPAYSDVKGAGFCDMLRKHGFSVTHMMTHDVIERYPVTMEE